MWICKHICRLCIWRSGSSTLPSSEAVEGTFGGGSGTGAVSTSTVGGLRKKNSSSIHGKSRLIHTKYCGWARPFLWSQVIYVELTMNHAF